MSDFGSKVRLATVRKRTSANGNQYFAGLLGNASIVMFRDPDSDSDWGEGWAVFIQERSHKRQTGGAQGQQSQKSSSSAKPVAKSATERARDGSEEKAKAAGDASAGRPFDDEIGF